MEKEIVWVVTRKDEGEMVYGVYTSHDKAQAFIAANDGEYQVSMARVDC